MGDNHIRCLNCGKISNEGSFCPYCGQPKSTGRLTMHELVVSVALGITRINKGFLHTCVYLLYKPWKVIKDYTDGKRQSYTPPVKTLLILVFLSVFISSTFDNELYINAPKGVDIGDSNYIGKWILYAIQFYKKSPIMQNLTMLLPVVPALFFIMYHQGTPKYNFAECLMASIYMSASLCLFRLLLFPINLIFSIEEIYISSVYILILGIIALNKALVSFNSSKWICIRITTFIVVSGIMYLTLICGIFSMVYYFIVKGNL